MITRPPTSLTTLPPNGLKLNRTESCDHVLPPISPGISPSNRGSTPTSPISMPAKGISRPSRLALLAQEEDIPRAPCIDRPDRRYSNACDDQPLALVGKKGSIELSQCNVCPWVPLKVKWRITDTTNVKDVYVGMYLATEANLGHYESSIQCRGHTSATSVMVSPYITGCYTLKIVRDGTETLAMTTFRVVTPLELNLTRRPGVWLKEPQNWPESVANINEKSLHALQLGLPKLKKKVDESESASIEDTNEMTTQLNGQLVF